MKKALLTLCVLALAGGALQAKDRQEKIAQTELPEKAQEFMAEHFAQSLVRSVSRSVADNGVETYYVSFKDKSAIEFDMAGAWSVISVKKGEISDVVVPVRLRATLRTTYAGKKVTRTENDGLHYRFVFDDESETWINVFGEVMEAPRPAASAEPAEN